MKKLISLCLLTLAGITYCLAQPRAPHRGSTRRVVKSDSHIDPGTTKPITAAAPATNAIDAFQRAYSSATTPRKFAGAYRVSRGFVEQLSRLEPSATAVRFFNCLDGATPKFIAYPMYRSEESTHIPVPFGSVYVAEPVDICTAEDCKGVTAPGIQGRFYNADDGDASMQPKYAAYRKWLRDYKTAAISEGENRVDPKVSFAVLVDEIKAVAPEGREFCIFHGMQGFDRLLLLVGFKADGNLDWNRGKILVESRMCPEECDLF